MTDRTLSYADRTTIARVAWSAVLVYAFLLTYLLLTPHPLWLLGGSGQVIQEAVDRTISGYIQHGLAYVVLGYLLVRASRTISGSWQILWALAAVGHGIVAEWLQCFVPHRFCDWTDGLANTLGVGLGWLVACLQYRRCP